MSHRNTKTIQTGVLAVSCTNATNRLTLQVQDGENGDGDETGNRITRPWDNARVRFVRGMANCDP